MLRTEPAQESRRERNKLEKLARIEKAARALFARRGFEATTTRAIAARADIGIGTLFLYFAKKEDLLVHLFQRDIAPVVEEIFATLPAAAPLASQLLHAFDRLYAYYERDPALSRVFVKELLFLDPVRRTRVADFTREFLRRLADLVVAARRRGALGPGAAPLDVAYAAFGLYCFTLINWLGGLLPDRAAARQRLRASLAALLTGLTPGRTR